MAPTLVEKHILRAQYIIISFFLVSLFQNSPKAGCSSDRDSPKPGSSHQRGLCSRDYAIGDDSSVRVEETESFLSGLPPTMFGKILLNFLIRVSEN